MPKIDGREMCRRLKQLPRTAAIKVIMMTSVYVSPKYGAEARVNYKVDDSPCKPVSPAAITAAIAKYVPLGLRVRKTA